MTNLARTFAALLTAALANGGCYRYAPISLGTVAPRDEVRVRITVDAAARLSKELGVYSTEIDGQFAPQGPDSVSVGVAIDRAYMGTTVGTTTQQLFLGRSEVVEVRKREFSRGRTILVSAGVVVGFGLLAAAVVQITDPNGDSQDPLTPPPPAPLRIPSGYHSYHIRLRIPLP